MFKLVLCSLFLALASCSTPDKSQKRQFEGHWTLLEYKCQDGDYTPAGKKLHDFYATKAGKRTMVIGNNKIVTTVLAFEDKSINQLPCVVKIESDATWTEKEYSVSKHLTTKTSVKDKECQGTSSGKGSGKPTPYTIEGDVLTFIHGAKIGRINPKHSKHVCKSSPLLGVFKRTN
jgi:hypothetical protein